MKKFLMLLLAICFSTEIIYSQNQLPHAKNIVEQACKEAAKENKKVFIIFHASWCGWCRKLDSSINDASCKDFFDKNYIIKHITVHERGDKAILNNPGGEEFLKEYHAENAGLPAWFIFDKDEKLLADSQIRPDGASLGSEGESVGCPAEDNEVSYFIKVLKQTATLTTSQEQAIIKRFQQNKISSHH